MRRVKPCEGEEPVAGFFKAVGHRPTLEPPLAEERLAPLLELGGGIGVDHVPIALGALILHMLRRIDQEVAVLVNRATLDLQVLAPQRHERGLETRGTVDDHELRSYNATLVEVI